MSLSLNLGHLCNRFFKVISIIIIIICVMNGGFSGQSTKELFLERVSYGKSLGRLEHTQIDLYF